MPTIQECIDIARIDLNDDDKERYRDAEHMLRHAREGVAVMLNMRPDLFFGNYDLDPYALALSDPIPFEVQYAPALQEYLVMRAQRKDDDYVNSGAVTLSAQFFERRLS
jgi:hypothetical protein